MKTMNVSAIAVFAALMLPMSSGFSSPMAPASVPSNKSDAEPAGSKRVVQLVVDMGHWNGDKSGTQVIPG
jgi:hypothetical protein